MNDAMALRLLDSGIFREVKGLVGERISDRRVAFAIMYDS